MWASAAISGHQHSIDVGISGHQRPSAIRSNQKQSEAISASRERERASKAMGARRRLREVVRGERTSRKCEKSSEDAEYRVRLRWQAAEAAPEAAPVDEKKRTAGEPGSHLQACKRSTRRLQRCGGAVHVRLHASARRGAFSGGHCACGPEALRSA